MNNTLRGKKDFISMIKSNHFLGVKVKITLSCPTLWDPIDCTVHGILQARILEWVAFLFSRGSSQPRDLTQVSLIAGGFFTSWATRKAQEYCSELVTYPFASGSSWPRNPTAVSCIAGRFFTNWAIREALGSKRLSWITCWTQNAIQGS